MTPVPYSKILLICLFFVCAPSLAKGLSYENFSNGYFTSIHVLIVNPHDHLIIPVKALGEKVCRETVAALANRHGATAAVNGGFWKLNGMPAGALKINHEWFGTPTKPRGAIGWSLINQKVLIDRILTNHSLTECSQENTIEVIPLSTLPHATSKEWSELEHIVGGVPVLIQNGYLIEDFNLEQPLESFLINRHPRTAVGITNNGDWIFVVVDCHFSRLFGGMTIKELSQFMIDLGCVHALNLDGGSSSTMVIKGQVINEPCGTIKEDGKYVEAVSDAILIF